MSITEIRSKKAITVEEAAYLCGYKESYIYRLKAKGILRGSRPTGGKLFFDREVLEKWMLSK